MSCVVKLLLGAVALGGAIAAFSAHPLHRDIVAQSHGLAEPKYGELTAKLDRLGRRNSAQVAQLPLLKVPVGPEVKADFEGGAYAHPLTVRLASAKEAPIHYTLDASTPTKESLTYDKPLFIDRTTILRFRSFLPGAVPGPTTTHTYMVDDDFGLAVLSLVIDPVLLWNKYSGIYAQAEKRGRQWERAAHVEYFQSKYSRPLRFPVEARIHGHWSREAPKKSFQLTYSTASLGPNDGAGILKSSGTGARQSTVILRAGAMDVSYRFGDELFRSIYGDAGGLVSRASPVMLLLNGEPWGIYNLHEKIDEAYLERRYGEGEYDFIGQERSPRVMMGDGSRWNDLIRFFATCDLTRDDEFGQAEQLLDIDNFTNHWLFNIYAANIDWPHSNNYAFRKIGEGERWRWISWDADSTFREDRHDTLAWSTRHGLRHDLSYGGTKSDADEFLTSTLIMRKLLENQSYRERFINRFCDLMNSHLLAERLQARFDQILAKTAPHLAVDWARWPRSREEYSKGVQGIRRFIAQRPENLTRHFQEKFHLGPLVAVTLKNDSRAGSIQINSLIPDHYPWTGRYFQNSRISLSATPAHGFEFAGWSDPSLGDRSQVTVWVRDPLVIEARYRQHAPVTETPTVKVKPPLAATVS